MAEMADKMAEQMAASLAAKSVGNLAVWLVAEMVFYTAEM